jgi:hypothetical protein
MAVSTAPTREKRRSGAGNVRKRKSRKSAGWGAQSWPLLLGIAVTPLTIHAASIMALAGPRALTMLYPWVLLLKNPVLRLGGTNANLSQWLMYIQFPLYGLLMGLIMRSKSLWFGLGVAAAVHSLAILAVFLASGGAS